LIFVSVRVDLSWNNIHPTSKTQLTLRQNLSALKQYTPTPTQDLLTGNEEGYSQFDLAGNAGEEYHC